jgi:hypothetical protein
MEQLSLLGRPAPVGVCRDCGKPVEKAKRGPGYTPWYCPSCKKERAKAAGRKSSAKRRAARTEEGRAEALAYGRAYYRANYETRFLGRGFQKRYGITIEDFRRMWDAQDGKCAVCQVAFPPLARGDRSGDRAVVDHDHSTGAVRGLLHSNCNKALGMLGDNISSLEGAIRYLNEAALGTAA